MAMVNDLSGACLFCFQVFIFRAFLCLCSLGVLDCSFILFVVAVVPVSLSVFCNKILLAL